MTEADASVASSSEVVTPDIPQVPDSPVQQTPLPEIPQQPTTPTPEPQTPAPEIPVPGPTPVAAEPAVPEAPPAVVVPASVLPSQSILTRGLEKIRFRKRAKLEKIVALAQKKGSITNDDVEKLLHVSDSTAQRYLLELVRAGRLKRSGTTTTTIYQPI